MFLPDCAKGQATVTAAAAQNSSNFYQLFTNATVSWND